jgi:hypothetical protein
MSDILECIRKKVKELGFTELTDSGLAPYKNVFSVTLYDFKDKAEAKRLTKLLDSVKFPNFSIKTSINWTITGKPSVSILGILSE